MGRRFDHLGDVEAFMMVIEQGSMTKAAVTLATTPSILSRAITRLESRLGVQLLRRTTRRLHLTDAGQRYLVQTRAAFDLIVEAEDALQGEDGIESVNGRVRMSVPTTYGHHRLPPMLAKFTETFPQVQLELSIINRNVDLIAEGYDLAIRLGPLPSSGLAARKLEDAPLRLVAAPGYLAKSGQPEMISELTEHRLLAFTMPSTGRLAPWLLRTGREVVEWLPEGRISVFDDVLGCVSLAEQGIGICQSYDFVVRDHIERGTLVEVLPKTAGATRPFSIIFATHRHLPSATRKLIDFLVQETR
ncbi:LysR family transcriptional regulator [Cypionkella sp.]|uniref:LysR family transcriptional regulator n=1 Tax=Cypionkella sp. TaxID=2811411 RepID=UPI002ABBFDD5|nr:LysR family transcriptional regulator [Cypionkella sp.]MDZ4393437.1 LysR family transcriptional regulator [Cypionkella sp.]